MSRCAGGLRKDGVNVGLMLSSRPMFFNMPVVVGPFQTDCDVSIWMSADALSQEAKWLLCCKDCGVSSRMIVEVVPETMMSPLMLLRRPKP